MSVLRWTSNQAATWRGWYRVFKLYYPGEFGTQFLPPGNDPNDPDTSWENIYPKGSTCYACHGLGHVARGKR